MPESLTVVAAIALFGAGGWFFYERKQRKTRAVPAGIQAHITLPHSQEWTLYHNAFSLCSKKIRVCLAEYNVPYQSVPVDLIETGRYENISRDFLTVNPGATVPVLLHNGHPIYESHEQLMYVAARVDQQGLLVPREADLRDVMEAWVHKTSLIGDDPIDSPRATAGNAVPGLTIPIFASMVATIPVARIFEGLLFHRIKQRAVFFLAMKFAGLRRILKPSPVVKIINVAVEAMSEHLGALEQQLERSNGPWICGAQFTLADVGMMVIFDRLREGDWLSTLVDGHPLLRSYWNALQQRDSYRVGCQKHEHPAVVSATEEIVDLKASGHWPARTAR